MSARELGDWETTDVETKVPVFGTILRQANLAIVDRAGPATMLDLDGTLRRTCAGSICGILTRENE